MKYRKEAPKNHGEPLAASSQESLLDAMSSYSVRLVGRYRDSLPFGNGGSSLESASKEVMLSHSHYLIARSLELEGADMVLNAPNQFLRLMQQPTGTGWHLCHAVAVSAAYRQFALKMLECEKEFREWKKNQNRGGSCLPLMTTTELTHFLLRAAAQYPQLYPEFP